MNFKTFRIPILIHPSFWLFILLIVGSVQRVQEGILTAIVVTTSFFMHSYGRACMASYYNIPSSITFYALGSRTDLYSEHITGKQHFAITFCGMIAQAALALLAHVLLKIHYVQSSYYLLYTLITTKYINILWTILNLFPLKPFDNGYMVQYLLERYFGYKGYRISIIVGIASAVLIIPYLYLNHFHFLIILQVFIAGLQYCRLWHEER